MTVPRFSVVVPTRNRPQALRRLLEALAAQQYPQDEFETILVDDGGAGSLSGLEQEYRGRLRLSIIAQAWAGCGPARQAGVDRARGQYLAFTDDDCCPAPDWLACLSAALDAHPGCAVGGRTVNAVGGNLLAESTQLIVNALSTYNCDEQGFIRYCPTSNAAFPAAPFRSTGGLDRCWANSGGEDRDLCARWIGAGFALRYEPLAVVLHSHPLTIGQFFAKHFRYGRGAWRFHHGDRAQGYERFSFYGKLVAAPFREYALGKAVCIAAGVLAAQVATAAGFLFEAVQRRGRRT